MSTNRYWIIRFAMVVLPPAGLVRAAAARFAVSLLAAAGLLTAAGLLLPGAAFGAEAPCGACHAEAAAAFGATPHGKVVGAENCSVCHGDGATHLASPSAATIRTFDTEPATEQNGVCTACHQDTALAEISAHSAAGLACSGCHAVHAEDGLPGKKKALNLPVGFERVTAGSSLCFDCHESVFATFAFNERHRLAEGAVSCTSCHDPHNPHLGATLGGFDDRACADCHADVTGPFVFEHAASRVEGCTACHEPHGSPNRHLLKFQAVGAQCYSCHAEVAQFHLGFGPAGPPRFNEETVCTNCHITIHGSNLDPLFLR